MDDLDRHILERDKKSPGFAEKAEAAYRRRMMMHRLAEIRRSLEASQTAIAALMETSAAIVSRTESGSNITFETFEKYAVALMRLASAAAEQGRKKPSRTGVQREIKKAWKEYVAFET